MTQKNSALVVTFNPVREMIEHGLFLEILNVIDQHVERLIAEKNCTRIFLAYEGELAASVLLHIHEKFKLPITVVSVYSKGNILRGMNKNLRSKILAAFPNDISIFGQDEKWVALAPGSSRFDIEEVKELSGLPFVEKLIQISDPPFVHLHIGGNEPFGMGASLKPNADWVYQVNPQYFTLVA